MATITVVNGITAQLFKSPRFWAQVPAAFRNRLLHLSKGIKALRNKIWDAREASHWLIELVELVVDYYLPALFTVLSFKLDLNLKYPPDSYPS